VSVVFGTVVNGPLEENCYIAGNPDNRHTVIIDPGYEPDRIISEVRALSLTVDAVLLTHCHFDHVGAVPQVAGEFDVKVYGPSGEEDLLLAADDMAAFFGMPLEMRPYVDCWFKPLDILDFKAGRFEVRDVHGHSPAGSAFVTGDICFSGDALFAGSVGRTDLPGADHGVLIDCIQRNLLTLARATRVFPGHGPSTSIGEEIDRNPFLTPYRCAVRTVPEFS